METLQAITSGGTPIQEIFLGRVVRKTIAEERPCRGGVAIEFDDSSSVYVWFEVVHLEEWEVTGALRIMENPLISELRGVSQDVYPPSGILISDLSLLCVDIYSDGAELQVNNGLVLYGSKSESVTIVSSPMAGAMDFGAGVALETLDTEYVAKSYFLTSIGQA